MAGLSSATRMGEGDAYVYNFQPALSGLNKAIATTQLADRKNAQAAQQALDKVLAENQAGKQGLRSADVKPYLETFNRFEQAAKAAIAEKDPFKKSKWNAIRNEAAGEMAKLTAISKETAAKYAQELSNVNVRPDHVKDEYDEDGKKINTRQHLASLIDMPSYDIMSKKALDNSKWFYDPLNVDVAKLSKDVLSPIKMPSYRNIEGKAGFQQKIVTLKHNDLPVSIEKMKAISVGNPENLKYANAVFKADKENAINGKDQTFKLVAQYAKEKGLNPDMLSSDPLAYVAVKLHQANKDMIVSTGEEQLTIEQKKKDRDAEIQKQKNWQIYMQDRAREYKGGTGSPTELIDDLFANLETVSERHSNGVIPLNELDPRLINEVVGIAKNFGADDADASKLLVVKNPNGVYTVNRARKSTTPSGIPIDVPDVELAPLNYTQTNRLVNKGKAATTAIISKGKTEAPKVNKTTLTFTEWKTKNPSGTFIQYKNTIK